MYRVTVKIERVNYLIRRTRPNEPETVTPELTIVCHRPDMVSAIDRAIRHLTSEWNAFEVTSQVNPVVSEEEDEEVEPL